MHRTPLKVANTLVLKHPVVASYVQILSSMLFILFIYFLSGHHHLHIWSPTRVFIKQKQNVYDPVTIDIKNAPK